MKLPSRRMPLAPIRKASPWAWPILAMILFGLGYWLYRQPSSGFFVIAVLVLAGIQAILDARYRKRIAASREGESICNFARSFDRHTDTWIIRAVYEELSKSLSFDNRLFPFRETDRFAEDLKIDPDDLNDLAEDVAFRAGRSMNGTEKNPLYGKIKTVGDLVRFFEYQPKIAKIDSSGLTAG